MASTYLGPRPAFTRLGWVAGSGYHAGNGPFSSNSVRPTLQIVTATSGSLPHTMSDFRIEKDSMGEVKVPAQAYYGAQTQRAVENFPVSGWPLPAPLIHAMGLV